MSSCGKHGHHQHDKDNNGKDKKPTKPSQPAQTGESNQRDVVAKSHELNIEKFKWCFFGCLLSIIPVLIRLAADFYLESGICKYLSDYATDLLLVCVAVAGNLISLTLSKVLKWKTASLAGAVALLGIGMYAVLLNRHIQVSPVNTCWVLLVTIALLIVQCCLGYGIVTENGKDKQ